MNTIIKNKKGAMLASDWVMGAVIFSGIIALLVVSLGSMVETYDTPNVTSDKFSNSFDRFNDNTKVASDMWNQTSGEGGLTTIGTYEVLFKATFGVFRLVFDSVVLAGNQMFSFVEFFGIPSEIGFLFFTLMISLLMIRIVFIIISSVRGKDV